MKILLAIDGSPASDRAIEMVATTTWPDGSRIQLVNVGEAHLAAYAVMPGVIFGRGGRGGSAARPGPSSRAVGRRGRPARRARALGRDNGHRGPAGKFDCRCGPRQPSGPDRDRQPRPGALGSAVFGSVAAEVVEYADTPVLIVRTTSISRLVLADDGSASATAARSLLGRMPGFQGLPVRVVSVVERQPSWFGWSAEAPAVSAALEDAIQAALSEHRTIATAGAAELSSAGLLAESLVPSGDPAHELVLAAEQFKADLIMMGTRGTTGLERLLLGSVARKVVQRAHCSVLVLRARTT